MLAAKPGYYYRLIREGKIQAVGTGRSSRAVYSSIVAYVQALVAEDRPPICTAAALAARWKKRAVGE